MNFWVRHKKTKLHDKGDKIAKSWEANIPESQWGPKNEKNKDEKQKLRDEEEEEERNSGTASISVERYQKDAEGERGRNRGGMPCA